MTTNINYVGRDNKACVKCNHVLESNLKELEDQIDCLQKSVATLRKDIPPIVIRTLLDMENRSVLCT
jgi:hypothetical protein